MCTYVRRKVLATCKYHHHHPHKLMIFFLKCKLFTYRLGFFQNIKHAYIQYVSVHFFIYSPKKPEVHVGCPKQNCIFPEEKKKKKKGIKKVSWVQKFRA